MISWLEAALSLAMVVFLACLLAGLDTGTSVAAWLFLVLLAAFAGRAIFRKIQGRSWQEAWRGKPPKPQ